MEINYLLKESKNNTCVVLGFFDGIHLGHHKVIQSAIEKARNTATIPALFTFLQNPKSIIKSNPVKKLTTQKQKENILRAMDIKLLYCIDFFKIMNILPHEFVKHILVDTLHAKYIFCGFNYRFGKNASAGAKELSAICKKYNIEVYTIMPVTVNGMVISSSTIRNLISNGNIKSANKMLGRDFSYQLHTIHGKHTISNLSVPTIKYIFTNDLIIPKHGIYKSYVIVDNLKYNSITYVNNMHKTSDIISPSCETYVFDYKENLYGKHIELFLTDFLKEEIKLSNISKLKHQIDFDIFNSTEKNK